MADADKILVENSQTVHIIHRKLKKEISSFAKANSWVSEKMEEYEKNLFQLFKDAIEETVKRNVCVNGKDLENEPVKEPISSSVREPLNKDRMKEVNKMWSSLEDILRETTKKRKLYPPLVVDAIKNVLQCKVDMLEAYSPTMKRENVHPTPGASTQDDECIERLQGVVNDMTVISKAFPELQDKLNTLQQALSSQQAMESSEVDAVLFNKMATPVSSRRSSRVSRTPNRFVSPIKTKHIGKTSIAASLTQRNLSILYKKK